MNKILSIRNLCASYNQKQVLNNVNVELIQSDFTLLCGPNGSGKSTLLTILAGLNHNNLKITHADEKPCIKYDNKILYLNDLKNFERAKYISFMQQNEFSTWDFSVYDIILSGRFPYSRNGIYSKNDYEITDKVISEMNLSDLKERTVSTLSGGEFQKVRIARSIAQEPDFMLLDEPSSNIDFVFEPELMQLLKNISRKNNIGILISMHNINLARQFADKIIFLPKNKPSICGETTEIFNERNLSETFGKTFKKSSQTVWECIRTE